MSYEKNMFFESDNDVFLTSNNKNRNKVLQEVKKTDTKYYKYNKVVGMKWQDGKYYDKVIIELFGSGDTGTKIRNAVTGAKTSYLVGSSNEDLFFKIRDSTGNKGRQESLLLFYDSPEQYENHNFLMLDQNIKEAWLNKNLEARKRLNTTTK
jgi:hypothetical protein